MWWRVHLAKAVVPGWSCRLVAETSRQRGDPGDGFAGWWRVSLAGMVLGEQAPSGLRVGSEQAPSGLCHAVAEISRKRYRACHKPLV